jgi:hypothetical protein
MREYLFIFGYESPDERRSNAEDGTDFESSGAVRIAAGDEAQALAWGNEIAERFVATLYGDSNVSWKKDGFAAWIEDEPDQHLRERWAEIPVVQVGEHPPVESL